MSLTWSDPPPPEAFDHPDKVAAEDERNGVTRCPQGCVAIANADPNSDSDSDIFTCNGCGGGVCLGCHTTPTAFPSTFCTFCNRRQAEQWSGLSDDDSIVAPKRASITAGQLRKLLEGVADDVPLIAMTPPSLKARAQFFDIMVARPLVHGRKALLGLELWKSRRD
ncbi:hypothetical protein ACWFMI_23055 [Nocardiopsis terrae]